MSTLGERLRAARTERGWTQAELAKKVGERSTSVISNWEKGNCNPDVHKIVSLCRALQVTPAYLLDYTPKHRELAPEIETIIEQIAYLDPAGRQLVKTVVELEYNRVTHAGEEDSDINTGEEEVPTRPINFYHLPVASGVGVLVNDDAFEPVDIPLTPTSREADFILEVSGDSMMPDYDDRDLILIRASEIPERGELGVFGLNNKAYFRRLERHELTSDNSKYKPIPFIEDDIICFGKVLGKTHCVEQDIMEI